MALSDTNLSVYANGGMQWLHERVFRDVLVDDGAIAADAAVVIVRLNERLHDE